MPKTELKSKMTAYCPIIEDEVRCTRKFKANQGVSAHIRTGHPTQFAKYLATKRLHPVGHSLTPEDLYGKSKPGLLHKETTVEVLNPDDCGLEVILVEMGGRIIPSGMSASDLMREALIKAEVDRKEIYAEIQKRLDLEVEGAKLTAMIASITAALKEFDAKEAASNPAADADLPPLRLHDSKT